MVLTQNFSGSH